MYDSLTLWLEWRGAGRVSSLLTNVKIEIDRDTDETFEKGRYGNLWVQVREHGVSVSGSLAKLRLGNNIERLTRQETERAIERLSDTFDLPFSLADVYRLELGANIIVKKPVSRYLGLFGDTKYLTRSTYSNGRGLSYANRRRSLTFYDKPDEMKQKREAIPEVFEGRNVLRYEAKFKKSLARQLGTCGTVKAFQLYDEAFYIKAIKRWREAYFKIDKQRRQKIIGIGKMNDVRDLKNQLALIGIQAVGGKAIVLEEIEGFKGKMGRVKYKRFKDAIKELTSDEKLTEPDDLILELDEKVKRAAAYYR